MKLSDRRVALIRIIPCVHVIGSDFGPFGTQTTWADGVAEGW